LRASRIDFIALEHSPEQVALSRRFGTTVYFGDPSKPELLRAAHAERAEVFVLTTDDPETTVRTARMLRRLYPNLRVFARARNRQHAFKLMDLGVEIIRETYKGEPRIKVDTFSGLLVDYAERIGVAVIVRGLRAISDFEYEFQMALMNRKLRQTVETVFMMPHERYTYISSRLIKEVASLGAPITGMVPPAVEARLAQKFFGK